MFNPNELVLEKIRAVEEYDPATSELTGRYTQIEEPSLKTSAEGTTVTDAMGAEIATFYKAQTGTFSFSNSLFSLDLAASQFGTEKEIADADHPVTVPVSEIINIETKTDGSANTAYEAKLKYVPIGTAGAEVKYVKVITDNNTFGETYTAAPAIEENTTEKVFVVNAADKTLTFPTGTTGRAFVQYERKSDNAVKVSKNTNGVPAVKSLLIHALFHDPCNTNSVYAGVINVPRAQINPEAVEISLTPDGKHSAEYKLQKPYCDENARLFDIIIASEN